MNLIALYSPAMGSGKTEIANYLSETHYFEKRRFADPIKGMALALFSLIGREDQMLDMVFGDLKEEPVEELAALGKITPREIMQTLGTEWGRNTLGENIWVEIAKSAIQTSLDAGVPVVVDDMRFPNEFEAMKAMGAKLVRVERPGKTVTFDHPSEGALEGGQFQFHYNVVNDGSLGDLFAKIHRIVQEQY